MDSGLELFREHPIDLIITDFHIQQGSGRRLLGAVRKIHPTIPVFLITGTPFVNEEDFAVYNFDKVYLKPFSCRALISEAIKAVARSNQCPM
jgi:CheY-like chemotaxis protein